MSLISAPSLHQLIDTGVITALHENVNSASIDLRLGDTILVEDQISCKVVDLAAKESPDFIEIKLGEDGFIVPPGMCFLAHTVEEFNLPNTISGQFVLRSSVGRCFLEHMQAGFADAGWHGSTLTMEFKNMLETQSILIKPGMRIGQMVFFEHEDAGADSYAIKGNYNQQKTVTKAFHGEGHKEDVGMYHYGSVEE